MPLFPSRPLDTQRRAVDVLGRAEKVQSLHTRAAEVAAAANASLMARLLDGGA